MTEGGNEIGCRTIVEEFPIGSHASNGIVERAVQTVKGQIRVMKIALEARLGMAEYASFLLKLGKDGKTAH